MGSICLIGRYPDWPAYADPLVVYPIEVTLGELEEWRIAVEEEGVEVIGPFRAVIAPDVYHKDNVSGGDWYGIGLPSDRIDPMLTAEPHETTFVSYLRLANASAGLSRCEPCAGRLGQNASGVGSILDGQDTRLELGAPSPSALAILLPAGATPGDIFPVL